MTELGIARVEPLDAGDWDRAWSQSGTATWFQARAWAETWSEFSRGGLRPEAKRIVFSDGVSVCVPICVQRGRLGGRVATHASPAGTAGGWIAHDGIGKEHAERLAAWLLAQPGLCWRANPFDARAQDAIAGRGDDSDPTWLVDLSPGFEAVHGGFSRKHRAAARSAEREGLRIDTATSDADWEGYLSAYGESLDRWGEGARTRYPPRLFRILRARCGGAMRLWLARAGDRVVAGAILFEAPAHTSYWHGATRSDAARDGAMPLLLRSALEHACAAGATAFDLGPSGGSAGVAEFKRRFGARPTPCPIVRTPPSGPRAWLARNVARGRQR